MILLLPDQMMHLIAGCWDWIKNLCSYKFIKKPIKPKNSTCKLLIVHNFFGQVACLC
jgi:hypothetical protein